MPRKRLGGGVVTLQQVSLYTHGVVLPGWSKAAGARSNARWHRWRRDGAGAYQPLCIRAAPPGEAPKSREARFHPSPFGRRCASCVRASMGVPT